ncbi:hypothetical protein BH11PSE4_BH11PSE4_42220 [soil metagenome]
MQKFRAKQITGHAGMLRNLAVLAVAGVTLSACGGGSMFGGGSPGGGGSSPSMTDRFSQLFTGKSTEVGAPQSAQADENNLTCPSVAIRPGASTYQVAAPGKQPIGNDLRYQATITRTARDCNLQNGEIIVRIGIQGRVIAGPSGAPDSVEVPLRVAVVQEGVNPKTIVTKVYRTTVQMGTDTSVPFSLVGEDLSYPAPVGAAGDSYIFYIGFDPQALKPERPAPRARRR